MKPTVKLDSAGIRKVLTSPAMQKVVKAKADEIRDRAGDGFTSSVSAGGTRARATVRASSRAARLRQARDHVLERAMGAG